MNSFTRIGITISVPVGADDWTYFTDVVCLGTECNNYW